MTDDQAPRARENDDGSVDIWLCGHQLHFPGGGGKPAVLDADLVPDEAAELPSGVLLDIGDPVTTVSYDGWYVRLSATGIDINRTRARRQSSALYRLRHGGY